MEKIPYKNNRVLTSFGLIIAALLVAAFFMAPKDMKFMPTLAGIICWMPFVSIYMRMAA